MNDPNSFCVPMNYLLQYIFSSKCVKIGNAFIFPNGVLTKYLLMKFSKCNVFVNRKQIFRHFKL